MAIIGLGLLLFALLIGNMQNFLQALGRRRLEMSLRCRDVEQWMSHRRLPKKLRRKVRKSERYNWAATRGVNEVMLLENLPEDLQREIRQHLFEFVKKVQIFDPMDKRIVDAICERLRQKTYIKGSTILVPDGLIDKVVFIVRGKLESIVEDKNIVPLSEDKNKDRLSEGDVCGEELLTWCLEHSSVNRDGPKIRILGPRLLSNRTVKCLTNVEAFTLRAADIEEVTSLFSGFLRNPQVQGAIRLGESLFMGSVDNASERMGNKKDRLPAEAKKILQTLASGWDDIIDSNALQVIPLKGAMTNEVYQIKWPTNTDRSRKVLVRIYGEGVEVFFDRENEIRTFEFMSKKGQGPRLLGRFSNGRIEEFIRARTLSAPDMRDPEISALIATKTKEFHDLVMPGPKTVLLWDRLRNWLGAAKSMSSPEEAKAFRLDSIEQEIYELENSLCGDQRVGFCHNDLQYGNIMIDEETRLITIIDYEYACYNPVAFDIANHFCEMAADYHTETPHLLDYNKYPDYNERRRFLHVYLSCSGEEPSDLEIEHLVQEVEKYALASHLFWGLWGFISEHVNEIDFDYMEYARQRLQQYWLRKPELLGSFTDAVANDK